MMKDEDGGRDDVAKVTHAHGFSVDGVLLPLDLTCRGAGAGLHEQGVVHGVAETRQDVALAHPLWAGKG